MHLNINLTFKTCNMKLLPILFFFFFTFSVKTEKTVCKVCCNKHAKAIKNMAPAINTPAVSIEYEAVPSTCDGFFFKI